jgi:hypothetical protein
MDHLKFFLTYPKLKKCLIFSNLGTQGPRGFRGIPGPKGLGKCL